MIQGTIDYLLKSWSGDLHKLDHYKDHKEDGGGKMAAINSKQDKAAQLDPELFVSALVSFG